MRATNSEMGRHPSVQEILRAKGDKWLDRNRHTAFSLLLMLAPLNIGNKQLDRICHTTLSLLLKLSLSGTNTGDKQLDQIHCTAFSHLELALPTIVDKKLLGLNELEAARYESRFSLPMVAHLRGRLEDVVVNDTYRGKQLGKLIVTTITMLAREMDCYKISLDCKDKMIPYYESLGFTLEPGNSNYMTMRILKCSL